MNIRHATYADLGRLLALCEEGVGESRYQRYAFNAAKAATLLERALEVGDVIVLVAVDDENVVQGFFAGVVTQHYFVDMVYATNIGLYMTPAKRGGLTAAKLVREFERLARERGASEIMLGATAGGVNAVRAVSFYKKLGYQPVGALTVKYGE